MNAGNGENEGEGRKSTGLGVDVAETMWACGLDFDLSVFWQIVIAFQNTPASVKCVLATDMFSLLVGAPSEK